MLLGLINSVTRRRCNARCLRDARRIGQGSARRQPLTAVGSVVNLDGEDQPLAGAVSAERKRFNVSMEDRHDEKISIGNELAFSKQQQQMAEDKA
jgi:hypothetical protein